MPDEEYSAPSDQGTIIIEEERVAEGWTNIPNTILRRPDLSPGAKLTYVMLLSYAHQKGSCFPGQKSLAKDLGAGERSVIRYLQELQHSALLVVKRRGLGKTNIYTLAKWVTARPDHATEPQHESRSAKLADQELPARSAKLAAQEVPIRQREERQEEERQEQQHGGVVAELTENRVTRQVAQRLAESFEADYIRSKIDLVSWLVAVHPRAVGKNAAGYLRRAIEEDYQPPADYKSPAERQAEAEAKARRQAELDAMIARQQEHEEQARTAEAEKKARALAAYHHEHPPTTIPGTELTTETAWQMALLALQNSMTAQNYETWLSQTILVSCDGSTALIAAPSGFVADWLRQRFTPLIRRELQQVLGFPVQLEYLAITEISTDQPERESPPPDQRPRPSAQPPHSAHPT